MKTDKCNFWAQIKTLRNEASCWLEVRNGVFTPFVRYDIAGTGFGVYDDIVIEYNMLPKDAGYVEIGKAYRKKLLDAQRAHQGAAVAGIHGEVRSRAHSVPRLEKASGQRFYPRNRAACNPRARLQKVDSVCGRVQEMRNRRSDILLGEFIAHVKKLGYRIHAHTNSTDCYTCSRMWNGGEVAAKNVNGTPQRGYFWGGGRAYNLCAKNAYEKFLPDQLKKVRDLGFQAPHYIDVFSAVPPYMCADPKHRSGTTRRRGANPRARSSKSFRTM